MLSFFPAVHTGLVDSLASSLLDYPVAAVQIEAKKPLNSILQICMGRHQSEFPHQFFFCMRSFLIPLYSLKALTTLQQITLFLSYALQSPFSDISHILESAFSDTEAHLPVEFAHSKCPADAQAAG